MRSARFLTVAIGLLACGLGGVAVADAIISPVNETIEPTFDIQNADVRREGDFLFFRMTLRSNAGTSLPPRTGKFLGSQMFAYIWPTSADSAAAGFPRGQGLLALALVSHPDLVEKNGNMEFSVDWHPHWMVLVPAMGCGPFGLRIVEGQPVAPGALPLLTKVASLPSAMAGPMIEVRVPAGQLGDPATLRFDGMTAAIIATNATPAPLMCVRPIDVASGRLVLQGTVTQTGR